MDSKSFLLIETFGYSLIILSLFLVISSCEKQEETKAEEEFSESIVETEKEKQLEQEELEEESKGQ
jgi:hypothetical protein